jgi:transposase-like protein
MRDPEERKLIAFAVKWHAGFKCQACGSTACELRPVRPESHHNTYGHDRPKDFLCLCSMCHAVFTWLQKDGRKKLLPVLKVQLRRLDKLRGPMDRGRVSQGMAEDFFNWRLDRLISWIDRLEWEASKMLALAEGRRAAEEWRDDQEGEQRRAA